MRLDHILIRASDLAAMRDFFVDVIGFVEGPRPPFPFPGCWLYGDGRPQIHLVSAAANDAQRGHLGTAAAGTSGAVDHVAVQGADYPALIDRLRQQRSPFIERHLPAEGHLQIFVSGPDGVKVEMLFPATIQQAL